MTNEKKIEEANRSNLEAALLFLLRDHQDEDTADAVIARFLDSNEGWRWRKGHGVITLYDADDEEIEEYKIISVTVEKL